MILVDSSVWIDYFNGQTTPQVDMLDQLLGTQPLAIGDLILASVGWVEARNPTVAHV